ncbi:MarR family transcriptional regulator [Candidatus Bipolaricaulota bacterium]|nr:MarR family transcriptional regulator [Candidatus Bipolaricaulota bacterium]
MSSISKRLQIAQPTASRMVDSLVEKGLVKRERSQADRRKVKLELTEKGESITDNVNEISYTLQELVEGFEEERQNELSHNLVDIAGKLQRQGHLSTALTCQYCRFFERNGGSSDERPHYCKLTGEDLTEEESYSEWVHGEGKIDLMAR